MENQPPFSSSDPRRYGSSSYDWERGIKYETEAEDNYWFLRRALEKCGVFLTTDTKILEIGSGSNVFLKFLQEQGHDATGLDARPRGEKIKNVVAGRVEQLPFSNETFDLIFSNSVFDESVYHQDQPAMIKEIARVLKRGGIYYDRINSDNNALLFREYFNVPKEGKSIIGSTVYQKK